MTAGRPTDYSPELAARICAELAAGKSLKRVCDMEGMPSRTSVFNWFGKYPDFLDKYETAKQEAADLFAEEEQVARNCLRPRPGHEHQYLPAVSACELREQEQLDQARLGRALLNAQVRIALNLWPFREP